MPTPNSATPPLRLITIRFSHYCEKVRWALDRAGLAYHEESHVPILSWAATFGAGGGRTVPVLVTPDRTLRDSTDILRWVDAQGTARPLFPSGEFETEVAQWEETFDKRVGPATRRLFYFHLEQHPALLRRLLESAGPDWQGRVARLTFPALRALMVRGMRVDASGAERSQKTLDEVLSSVGARLADGRRYLAGEHFSAADLTFASLMVPVVLPEPLLSLLPFTWDEFPADLRASVERMRATPAGQFVLRMYAEERSLVPARSAA